MSKLILEEEKITIRGQTLSVYRPARLEDIFQGDPFLEVEKFPFWFKIWESSLILADYIATLEPSLEILELGAGLGVASLFASYFGHKVLATDYEDLPLELIKKSAQKNGLLLEVRKLDWRKSDLSLKFDIIMGAEIVFKKSLYDPLLNIFNENLKESGQILIAHSMERKRILVPFLYKAEPYFEIQTSLRRLKGTDEMAEIILNRLLPKK